jgi:hypothetical protein
MFINSQSSNIMTICNMQSLLANMKQKKLAIVKASLVVLNVTLKKFHTQV